MVFGPHSSQTNDAYRLQIRVGPEKNMQKKCKKNAKNMQTKMDMALLWPKDSSKFRSYNGCAMVNTVKMVSDFGHSDQHPITGRARQGCVLSSRSFCADFEFAMRKWRHAIGRAGIDLMDGGPNLLDLRFVNGILILCFCFFFLAPFSSQVVWLGLFIGDILILPRSCDELWQLADSWVINIFGAGRFAHECKQRCGANQ